MMAVLSASFDGKGIPPPSPIDFDETFVRIGRVACEEYYRAEGIIIDAWLRERGKQRLINERATFVKANEIERNATKRLSRRDVQKFAYRVNDKRRVSPVIAQRAAHHLRICRNGGWIISPIGDGLWRLGLRVVSAAELLDLANANGFSANLPGGD